MAGSLPHRDVGITPLPTDTACSAFRCASSPTRRLIQPTRAADPRSASSISSIAEKCDRFGCGRPTACTTANLFCFHSDVSGLNSGCRPNIGSLNKSARLGTLMRGRCA